MAALQVIGRLMLGEKKKKDALTTARFYDFLSALLCLVFFFFFGYLACLTAVLFLAYVLIYLFVHYIEV